jgi:hypothetical protein
VLQATVHYKCNTFDRDLRTPFGLWPGCLNADRFTPRERNAPDDEPGVGDEVSFFLMRKCNNDKNYDEGDEER